MSRVLRFILVLIVLGIMLYVTILTVSAYSIDIEFTLPTIDLTRRAVIVKATLKNNLFISHRVEVLSYKLIVEGNEVALGKKYEIYVPANSEVTVSIPIIISKNVSNILIRIIQNLSKSWELEYRIKGEVRIAIMFLNRFKLFSITRPYETIGHLVVKDLILTPSQEHVEEQRSVIVEAYWTVNGVRTYSVKADTIVTIHVKIKGYIGDVIFRIKQDRKLLPDVVIYEAKLHVMGGIAIPFRAEGGFTVKGYFIEVEGPDWKYIQPNSYPPRLKVEG